MSSHLYGTLTRDGDHWIIAAEPHVIIRLKRLFGRARNNTVGKLRVKAAPDISEDLEWVLGRWPLAISDHDRRILTREADTARQRIFDVQRILAGYTRPVGNRTPTRPFRDYQLVAGNLAHTTGRLLLTDDLGLGKTTSAATLFRDPATLPAVVVAPTHLATPGRRDDGQPRSQWARELLESFPDLNIHVAKTGKPPTNLDPMADVVVLNYHKLTGWADWLAAAGVRTVIFDEVQELRRSQSRKYQSAAALARHCLWRLGLSATPIYNYGGELWNVMNVIAPDELGTREEFGREWCGASNGIDDKTIVTDMAGLSSWLTNQGLMLRRTRADVKRELPALQPIIHDLPADEHSLAMLADADILAATMLAGDIDRYTRGRVAAEFDMRLRQATGLAKAPYVAEFVRMLVSEGPVLLFGWHRACFAPGTLVLNHDGSTIPIESIKVGDKVMGPDSEPREVKSLVTGYGRMYRIVPNKGDEWVCSANHILTVWNCQAKRYEKWTADQFASRSPRWQRDRLLYRSEAVAFPAGEPVMEPWLLGYWLGDGASDLRDLRVLSADQEVIDECVAIAERHSLVLREYDAPGVTGKSRCKHLVFSLGSGHQRSGRYRNPLLQEFKTMGLVGNKHIPLKVLASSIADRWQVLAGLIDSDGHVCQGNGRGTAEINTVLPRLASDIARLARSLGLAAYVSISKFESSADPRFGRGSTRQRLYRVTISGDMTPLPTRIVRKAPLSRSGQKNVLHVGFRIEPAPDGPFFGFEVDRDRLFLLADFTVVHNCYDVWADQLAELRPAFYTGHETPRQKDEAVSRFIDGDTDLLVLSLRSGAGIDGLQHRCSTVAFGEFDWSPGVHDQCVGRVFRDGQTDPVTAFYLATEFGSDPTVLGVLGVKSDQSQQLLDPAGNPFQVQQADPHRVTRLAEAWLRSRNLNAAKILADNPHAA